MASVLFALGYCIKQTIMAHKEKKNEQLPSEARQQEPKGETLREKAAKKLHGKGSNPSQLGDPISLKAETSSDIPTDSEQGSQREEVPDAAPASSGDDAGASKAAAGGGNGKGSGSGGGASAAPVSAAAGYDAGAATSARYGARAKDGRGEVAKL
jgi:hypothetical protein